MKFWPFGKDKKPALTPEQTTVADYIAANVKLCCGEDSKPAISFSEDAGTHMLISLKHKKNHGLDGFNKLIQGLKALGDNDITVAPEGFITPDSTDITIRVFASAATLQGKIAVHNHMQFETGDNKPLGEEPWKVRQHQEDATITDFLATVCPKGSKIAINHDQNEVKIEFRHKKGEPMTAFTTALGTLQTVAGHDHTIGYNPAASSNDGDLSIEISGKSMARLAHNIAAHSKASEPAAVAVG